MKDLVKTVFALFACDRGAFCSDEEGHIVHRAIRTGVRHKTREAK